MLKPPNTPQHRGGGNSNTRIGTMTTTIGGRANNPTANPTSTKKAIPTPRQLDGGLFKRVRAKFPTRSIGILGFWPQRKKGSMKQQQENLGLDGLVGGCEEKVGLVLPPIPPAADVLLSLEVEKGDVGMVEDVQIVEEVGMEKFEEVGMGEGMEAIKVVEEEYIPYWNQNLPPSEWEIECPSWLVDTSEKNKGILSTRDEEFVPSTWEEVRGIVCKFPSLSSFSIPSYPHAFLPI